MTDPLTAFVERQKLIRISIDEFEEDTTSVLTDLAEKWSEKSGLHFNRVFELAIQIQREFGHAEDLFEEARGWVWRTAEEKHPHNLQLYLKALVWTINRRRWLRDS